MNKAPSPAYIEKLALQESLHLQDYEFRIKLMRRLVVRYGFKLRGSFKDGTVHYHLETHGCALSAYMTLLPTEINVGLRSTYKDSLQALSTVRVMAACIQAELDLISSANENTQLAMYYQQI